MYEFKTISVDGRTVFARADFVEVIAAALLEGQGAEELPSVGRGNIARFPLTKGRWGIVRRYRRGGLAARLGAKGFLRNRPRAEFEVHLQALASDAPLPPLLGVMFERRHGLYYGAIATEETPGVTLWDFLQAHTQQEARHTLRVCGAVIRQLHDAGVFHADLQIKNVLVNDRDLYLIDLDKAHIGTVSAMQRQRNLLRLRRSLEKNGFPVSYFEAVRAGYNIPPAPRWLQHLYHIKGRFSDAITGRHTQNE